MWERGARHNPASFRYRYYLDHRPILPQDPTLGFLRKSYNVYQNIYFTFKVAKGKNKIVFSNNIPVHDREVLKELTSYDQTLRKNFKFFSLISTIFLSGFLFENVNFQKNYLKRFLAIGAIFFSVHTVIHRIYLNHFNDLTSYYYYKYQHLFVDSLEEVEDNRRKFFQLDTSSYYRDTAETIRHSAHHPADKNHHDHDTSTYYGPYPVIYIFY